MEILEAKFLSLGAGVGEGEKLPKNWGSGARGEQRGDAENQAVVTRVPGSMAPKWELK